MTTAIIGTGGIDRPSRVSSPPAGRPCNSRAPTTSRHEGSLRRSARLLSSRSTTGARCREPTPSFSRCGSPC